MSKWNTLLQSLDQAYGAPDLVSSRIKTVKQAFDNNKQEHVVNLLYMYRRGDTPVNKEYRQRKQKEEIKKKKANKQRAQQRYPLLKPINDATSSVS